MSAADFERQINVVHEIGHAMIAEVTTAGHYIGVCFKLVNSRPQRNRRQQVTL